MKRKKHQDPVIIGNQDLDKYMLTTEQAIDI